MSRAYGVRPDKKSFTSGGLGTIPQGAHLIPTGVRSQYDAIPFHAFHPGPHDMITILRSRKSPHEWLVCGWYIDTYREGGEVKGLLYRQVVSEPDREAVLNQLKKHDKEASPKFAL